MEVDGFVDLCFSGYVDVDTSILQFGVDPSSHAVRYHNCNSLTASRIGR